MFGGVVDEKSLTVLEQRRARAEAETYVAMLDYADQQELLSKDAASPMAGLVERSMIATEIATAMGLSEGQVISRLAFACRVRDQAPATWDLFRLGHIDAARVRLVSSTIDKLVHPESVEQLDAKVGAYACGHTVGELKVWLRRFMVRVEADAATERAEQARADRFVKVEHDDDGMSWLTAYLPTPAAAAIERRLRVEAKNLPADDRTRVQKQADLLAAWATSNEGGEFAPAAHIAVTISADDLAGATFGFAEAPDGSWVAPAQWICDLATSGNVFWHRIVVDPVTNDTLTHESLGRFAPETIRQALTFRDGVCSAAGCLVPADQCDIDHVQPWPVGKTKADNLDPKCRRHHAQKSHGLSPPRRRPPLEIRTEPVSMNIASDLRPPPDCLTTTDG